MASSRKAAVGEGRDELQEPGAVVAEGIGRREQQLIGPDPAQDVRHLHHVDPPDAPAEPIDAGNHPCPGQLREVEDLPKGHRLEQVGDAALHDWRMRTSHRPVNGRT